MLWDGGCERLCLWRHEDWVRLPLRLVWKGSGKFKKDLERMTRMIQWQGIWTGRKDEGTGVPYKCKAGRVSGWIS